MNSHGGLETGRQEGQAGGTRPSLGVADNYDPSHQHDRPMGAGFRRIAMNFSKYVILERPKLAMHLSR